MASIEHFWANTNNSRCEPIFCNEAHSRGSLGGVEALEGNRLAKAGAYELWQHMATFPSTVVEEAWAGNDP